MKNLIFVVLVIFSACKPEPAPELFDLQGHRGARGLLPENTIPGFLKAVDLGVTTIEMDLVVTRDRELLVSHEPWFNHHISTKADGTPVIEQEQQDLNIFEMAYEETQQFDVGIRGNINFPNQEPLQTTKPRFRDAVTAIENYAGEAVRYNIETKSRPEWYGEWIPQPEEFTQLLFDEIVELNIMDRVTVQSFDPATLIEFRKLAPGVSQALLVSNNDSMEINLERLGYIPEIYSPHYELVTPDLITAAREKEMQIIPWTVNTVSEMERLLDMGVDGIITDFPDSAAILR